MLLSQISKVSAGLLQDPASDGAQRVLAWRREVTESTVGSSHRPALSRPAQRLAPCVRPGLGEKDYIIGPWPLTFPCSVPNFFYHEEMSSMESSLFINFTPKISLSNRSPQFLA